MPRIIIQFALDGQNNLNVLCDDGSMWCLGSRGWMPIEPIPQDGYDESPAFAIPTPLAEPLVSAKPAWLECRVGLWAVTNDGDKATAINGITELREAATDPTVTVVEARSNATAFSVYRSNRDYAPSRNFFTAEGQRFEYLTDELPF